MLNMPKKSQDVAIILRELLEQGFAGTQDEIRLALEKDGITVSQSKISRLLHKISAVKVTDANGRAIYRLSHDYGLTHEFINTNSQSSIGQLVTGVTASDTLLVIHTNPGAASLVGRIIDQEKQTLEILGCIAGDDTIFVAPKSSPAIQTILSNIKRLLYCA
jgi:transcriptional regulator of arginine metabolism